MAAIKAGCKPVTKYFIRNVTKQNNNKKVLKHQILVYRSLGVPRLTFLSNNLAWEVSGSVPSCQS